MCTAAAPVAPGPAVVPAAVRAHGGDASGPKGHLHQPGPRGGCAHPCRLTPHSHTPHSPPLPPPHHPAGTRPLRSACRVCSNSTGAVPPRMVHVRGLLLSSRVLCPSPAPHARALVSFCLRATRLFLTGPCSRHWLVPLCAAPRRRCCCVSVLAPRCCCAAPRHRRCCCVCAGASLLLLCMGWGAAGERPKQPAGRANRRHLQEATGAGSGLGVLRLLLVGRKRVGLVGAGGVARCREARKNADSPTLCPCEGGAAFSGGCCCGCCVN